MQVTLYWGEERLRHLAGNLKEGRSLETVCRLENIKMGLGQTGWEGVK
jgi:hypothetical protein